jgi:indole-3-acetate monooxygenase
MAEVSTILSLAEALGPSFKARAQEMEQARRMPVEMARMLAQIGVYRMLRPASLGGLECTPALFLQTVEVLAKAEASVGWCAMIGATSGIYAAYLSSDVAREIFGVGDDVITGGVFAPMGQAIVQGDSYLVSGHWRWASGSQNCQWLSGGCTVLERGATRKLANGQVEVRAVLFPAADAELIDTWHTMGLCASGSGDMKVSGIRVPKERSVSLQLDKPLVDGALFAFPVFGLLALGIAAVASGNARAALEEFCIFAGGAQTAGARKVLAERAPVQEAYARMDAALRSARAFLYDEVAQAWERDRPISLEARAKLRLAATHMTRTAAQVCREAQDLCGGASVFTDNSMQRKLRDAQTMTAHMMIAPASYELAGRVLLGLPTDDGLI